MGLGRGGSCSTYKGSVSIIFDIVSHRGFDQLHRYEAGIQTFDTADVSLSIVSYSIYLNPYRPTRMATRKSFSEGRSRDSTCLVMKLL